MAGSLGSEGGAGVPAVVRVRVLKHSGLPSQRPSRRRKTPMEDQQYVGIDLHRRRSVIVRVDEYGERSAPVRIDNDAMALAAEVAKAGEHPEVVLEATYGWYWAVDVLQELGATVHLAHPLGLNWGHRRRKDDVADATDLVDMLRLGRLPEAWIAPPAVPGAARAGPLPGQAGLSAFGAQGPGARRAGQRRCARPGQRPVRGVRTAAAGRGAVGAGVHDPRRVAP